MQLLMDAHFTANEVNEIAKMGHWLHAENPKQFYEDICDFF